MKRRRFFSFIGEPLVPVIPLARADDAVNREIVLTLRVPGAGRSR